MFLRPLFMVGVLASVTLAATACGRESDPKGHRPPTLRLEIESPQQSLALHEGSLSIKLQNVGKEPVRIMEVLDLMPDGKPGHLLVSLIDGEGRPIERKCCVCGRVWIGEHSYKTVAPGESRTWYLDLRFWEFDKAAEGVVTMRARYVPDNSACRPTANAQCAGEEAEASIVRFRLAGGTLSPPDHVSLPTATARP